MSPATFMHQYIPELLLVLADMAGASIFPDTWDVLIEVLVGEQTFRLRIVNGDLMVQTLENDTLKNGGAGVLSKTGFDERASEGSGNSEPEHTAHNPELILRFSTDSASWDIGALEVLPAILRKMGPRLLKGVEQHPKIPVDIKALLECAGDISIDYTDDAGDEARCLLECAPLNISTASRPKVRIAAGDRDLWQILNGGSLYTALMRSRARIDGDVGFLLRVFKAAGDSSRP